jgi:hypothetical protein
MSESIVVCCNEDTTRTREAALLVLKIGQMFKKQIPQLDFVL